MPSVIAMNDLHWALSSPSLLAPNANVIDDAQCARTVALSQNALNPEALHAALAPAISRGRLGPFFEAQVEFWLKYAVGVKKLASNVQIREGMNTIGELDLVFVEPVTGQVTHWELAAKFYLKIDDKFVGPNVRDRLDLKLAKILGPQLALVKDPRAQATLQSLGFTAPAISQALIKGRLFYPSSSDWRASQAPAPVSPTHARGWWTDQARLEIPSASPRSKWVRIPKLRWLAPVDTTGAFTLDELIAQVRAIDQPSMVAEIDESGRELSRGMIVSRDWPEAAKQA